MLTTQQIRRTAEQSGARDIEKVETDIVLTHLLQLFHEKGIAEQIAFKGGTMLRKMVFGPRGRYSTDLDFTLRPGSSQDRGMEAILDALAVPYRGIAFRLEDRDWYLTEDGFAANPACSHEGNERGVKIKIQVSAREAPILPVKATPQIEQAYFKDLGFTPVAIPSLAFEEILSEKIRAASQRSKIRDLHDLSQAIAVKLDRDLTRALAVVKLWESDKDNLDYDLFIRQVAGGKDYDVNELRNLLRKDEQPDLNAMIKRVTESYRWLGQMTDLERKIAQDANRILRNDVAMLKAEAAKRVGLAQTVVETKSFLNRPL
jgi:predicted nucleotidyltransferase component of viral defense system